MADPLTANSFFDLSDYDHRQIFADGSDQAWRALANLKEYLGGFCFQDLGRMEKCRPLSRTIVLYDGRVLDGTDLEIEFGAVGKGGLKVFDGGEILAGASVIMAGAVLQGDGFSFGEGVLVESGAFLQAPIVLGDWSEVRQGAYLRGNCLIGRRCVVGHVTEVKGTIFLDDAKAGHFAYLGDSILGNNVNLGAGTKTANLRFMGGNVSIRTPEALIDSGLRKLGAVMGDLVQTGCNSVTNPGTLIGKRSFLMPNTTAQSGYHPDSSIIR